MKAKTSQRCGCALALYILAAVVTQVVFLTLKLSGAVSWSWWIVLIPILSPAALSIVGLVLAVIILTPIQTYKTVKKRRRIEKQAEIYGMKRKPRETDGELKKRIVQRNMIAGNYSRRDIKDAVLANFDTVSACKMTIDNQNYTVAVELTHAPSGSDWKLVSFTDEELQEILDFITQYVPVQYKVSIKNAEIGGEADE